LGDIITVHSEALVVEDKPHRCQLVVVEGPDMGRATNIQGQEVTVGTDADCDLVLTDERVSRRHLGVRLDGGRFVVRDLGSRNGTLYEGSLLSAGTVSAGATIKIGRSFLRIQPRPQPMEVAPSQSRRFGELVAESLAMREVIAVLELAAESDVTVLIEGETGTGKELAARALHDASPRRKGPFVVIDCGALPDTLLESELFGHVKGAFTGAASNRAGAFARAHGGTIFLDELAGVPLSVQARLLRVIEERKVRPVGADKERAVDVRVVAASTRDLASSVTEGTFRPDLYYRLSVVKIALPALRSRREDIAPIVAELMRRRGMAAGPIEGANYHRLLTHAWPGNVRELRNVIDRAIALSPGAEAFGQLRLGVRNQSSSDEALTVRTDLPYGQAKAMLLDTFERLYLRDVFERCDGNISAAAREAELDRKHLRSLLRRQGLLPGSGEED
jgi:transcriptional regulator with PAS, ATPase and Fis domain